MQSKLCGMPTLTSKHIFVKSSDFHTQPTHCVMKGKGSVKKDERDNLLLHFSNCK